MHPERSEGTESTGVRTVTGNGWSVRLGLFGPLGSWFVGTWKANDFESIDG